MTALPWAVSPAPATPASRWRVPGWRRWLLAASLAGNVFLLAHAAGPVLRPHRPPGFGGMVEHFARNLPPDDAARFRATMAREQPAFEATRRDMDQARAELSRAIARTPYDEALVRERMADWQDHLRLMSARFGQTLLLTLPELSPAGRARLADAADHPPPGPPPPPDAPAARPGVAPDR